ncbi:hypothetical protein HY631_04550 [Candidatus Uhrbacteria bacterium]|nr:hypothetical protein [Candidatus Uhrbacteria bacterium]
MKRAAIVVGPHHSGKSRTLREFLKPLLRISSRARRFLLDARTGAVLSQSLEERVPNGAVLSQTLEERRVASTDAFIARYGHFTYLVCAARPPEEPGSLYTPLITALERQGFSVFTVRVNPGQPASFYEARAHDIVEYLRGA